ncbi:MAG: arsenate reductase [Rhodobacterales bacterium]|nr:MAG: arsenate reductase [Rhodobacterales bacterium]
MKLYGLKNCDTCRRALKALQAAGHDVALVDVRNEPIDRADLERWHAQFGAALLNRRSTTWRTLDEAQRQQDPVSLLQEHPALMKRPVVVNDAGEMSLGWDQAAQRLWSVGP